MWRAAVIASGMRGIPCAIAACANLGEHRVQSRRIACKPILGSRGAAQQINDALPLFGWVISQIGPSDRGVQPVDRQPDTLLLQKIGLRARVVSRISMW